MKKVAMGIAALMTIAPAPFVIERPSEYPIISILVVVVLCWACVEFFIGLSRPCEGKAPSCRLIKLSRIIWPLFILYSWLDFRNDWTLLHFSSWFLLFLILMCILALGLRLWAVIHLGQSFTYDVKSPGNGILATTGPYRIIRHPAYLAVCVLGSFPGLCLGSIPGFIGMLGTTIFPVVSRTDAEEQILEKEFGDHFIKYKRNTYSLIPFIY
jgi:protein-S-isoprenylcysteine O-methyltransferase Ste14